MHTLGARRAAQIKGIHFVAFAVVVESMQAITTKHVAVATGALWALNLSEGVFWRRDSEYHTEEMKRHLAEHRRVCTTWHDVGRLEGDAYELRTRIRHVVAGERGHESWLEQAQRMWRCNQQTRVLSKGIPRTASKQAKMDYVRTAVEASTCFNSVSDQRLIEILRKLDGKQPNGNTTNAAKILAGMYIPEADGGGALAAEGGIWSALAQLETDDKPI
jgi:hypothetical protein